MINKLTFTLPFIILWSCKDNPNASKLTFKLVERNSYYIDSYNGLSVYRDNETHDLLNGYYVVGDKFKKWEEFDVKEGLLNGENIIFHDNGEIFSITNYSKGKRHGEEKRYTRSGKLSKVNTYKNGVKYGKSLSYFESGQLQREAKIEDEEVIESTSYNLIGEIESQMFIKDGKKITQYIKSGNVVSEQISSTYDNFEAVKFYNEDGSLKLFLQTLTQGDDAFLIERDETGNEIRRVNVKKNPEEAMKYKQLIGDLF